MSRATDKETVAKKSVKLVDLLNTMFLIKMSVYVEGDSAAVSNKILSNKNIYSRLVEQSTVGVPKHVRSDVADYLRQTARGIFTIVFDIYEDLRDFAFLDLEAMCRQTDEEEDRLEREARKRKNSN